MKKILFCTIFLSAAQAHTATAQNATIFPKGEKSPNVHHIGDVWLKELNAADSILNISVAVATFAPNAYLYWHKHPAGQILMITEGIGYYQERGRAKQTLHKGEVVKCQPNVEHWHGASPENGFTYVAVTPAQKGKTIWLDKVTDAEYHEGHTATEHAQSPEKTLLELSKTKWRLMAERNMDSLNLLFDEKAVFVHMGGTMTKEQEMNVIKSGGIQYKHAEIQESSVQFVENTAILLNKIRLTAIVGGNEVVNPFMVTEVYILKNNAWVLGSLSFTKLLTPP